MQYVSVTWILIMEETDKGCVTLGIQFTQRRVSRQADGWHPTGVCWCTTSHPASSLSSAVSSSHWETWRGRQPRMHLFTDCWKLSQN